MSKRGRKPLEGLRKATRGKPSERHDVIISVNFEDYGVKFALTLEISMSDRIEREKKCSFEYFSVGELPVACLALAAKGRCYSQTRPNFEEILIPTKSPNLEIKSDFIHQILVNRF